MKIKPLLLLILLCYSNLIRSQDVDSIFESIEENFEKSIKSQEQLYNFYVDDFLVWKDKVDLTKLTLKPEKAEILEYDNLLSNRNKVLSEVNKYIGVPYIWGGSDPNGFDCSGLVQWVIKKTHGILIPRTTKMQSSKWKNYLNYNLSQIQPGDLIYFKTIDENQISHVGVYVDNNSFIHAPNRKEYVKKSNLFGYWNKKFAGFLSLDKIIY
tara:strand:- start:231 stop:863 length:633 start_codon:yes stop_codon:yes gene_type:complete